REERRLQLVTHRRQELRSRSQPPALDLDRFEQRPKLSVLRQQVVPLVGGPAGRTLEPVERIVRAGARGTAGVFGRARASPGLAHNASLLDLTGVQARSGPFAARRPSRAGMHAYTLRYNSDHRARLPGAPPCTPKGRDRRKPARPSYSRCETPWPPPAWPASFGARAWGHTDRRSVWAGLS